MSGYTKGPWNIHPCYPIDSEPMVVTQEDGTTFVSWTARIAVGNKLIGSAEMRTGTGGFPMVESMIEARANARLMAASTELLEALKWCVNHLKLIEERDYPDSEEKMRRFNSTAAGLAAIAKAESL